MYQELIVHFETFQSPEVWSTEGNDLPLPALAVGDVLEVPPLAHERDRDGKPAVFRITAVKHTFTDTGSGPEANHRVLVTVKEDGSRTPEEELDDALGEVEKHQQIGAFWRGLLEDVAEQRAPALMDAVLQGIRQAMKSQPAHLASEARNAWQEAASILQADGHYLAEVLQGHLGGSVYEAIKALPREERLLLWLNEGGFHEEWETAAEPRGFEPDSRSDALDRLQEKLLRQLNKQLLDTRLD